VDPYQLIFGNNLLILEKKTAFQAHFVISQPGAQPTHFEQQLTHFGRIGAKPPLFSRGAAIKSEEVTNIISGGIIF